MVNTKLSKVLGLTLAAVLALSACAAPAGGGAGSQAGGSDTATTAAGSDTGATTATTAASTGGGSGKWIYSALTSEPGSLDPATSEGTHQSFPLRHLFAGLTRITEDGKVENVLAEKVDISEDGLTYTVTLKEGLKWSDGSPLTAYDYEFAWKRLVDPTLAADYAYILYPIKGAEEYNTGMGSADDIAITVIDDRTFSFELKNPVAYFDSLLGFYPMFPVSKAVAEANPDWAKSADTFVSNGPFILKEWQPNAKVILEKNPYYHDADKVKLDGINWDVIEDQSTVYQKYLAGDYNFVVELPTEVVGQLVAQNDPELVIGGQFGLYYYNLNLAVPELQNVKIRTALSLAIDREIITKNITKGGQIPATAVVPAGVLDDKGMDFSEANKGMIKTDVEAAKKLLAEGMAEAGIGAASDIHLTLLYNTSENHKRIAEAVQQMWNKELGINVTLENVEFKVKLEREETGEYQISRAGWIGDYLDPMTFMDIWVTGGAHNNPGYSNPEYDALIAEAFSSTDDKVRMDSMKAAEKMILEDMPIVPVYYYTHPYLVRTGVTGVFKTPTEYPALYYADIAE